MMPLHGCQANMVQPPTSWCRRASVPRGPVCITLVLLLCPLLPPTVAALQPPAASATMSSPQRLYNGSRTWTQQALPGGVVAPPPREVLGGRGVSAAEERLNQPEGESRRNTSFEGQGVHSHGGSLSHVMSPLYLKEILTLGVDVLYQGKEKNNENAIHATQPTFPSLEDMHLIHETVIIKICSIPSPPGSQLAEVDPTTSTAHAMRPRSMKGGARHSLDRASRSITAVRLIPQCPHLTRVRTAGRAAAMRPNWIPHTA